LTVGPPARLPAVVFVTAFDAYAVRAFRAHALDYRAALLRTVG
jgi:DNA-binding LytR/AlgR family response regulator